MRRVFPPLASGSLKISDAKRARGAKVIIRRGLGSIIPADLDICIGPQPMNTFLTSTLYNAVPPGIEEASPTTSSKCTPKLGVSTEWNSRVGLQVVKKNSGIRCFCGIGHQRHRCIFYLIFHTPHVKLAYHVPLAAARKTDSTSICETPHAEKYLAPTSVVVTIYSTSSACLRCFSGHSIYHRMLRHRHSFYVLMKATKSKEVDPKNGRRAMDSNIRTRS